MKQLLTAIMFSTLALSAFAQDNAATGSTQSTTQEIRQDRKDAHQARQEKRKDKRKRRHEAVQSATGTK